MFDLGLGSLEALTLEDLGYLLVAIAACFAAVVLIGVDGIIAAIAMRYAIAVFAELGRRGWCRIKTRLCAPR
jgi:hypothetical protein